MSDSGNIKVSQVRGNFNRIARDLDRALSVAGFNATEAFLIARARESSWPHHAADGEPQPFSINLSEAARLLGRERSWVSRIHKGLVESRVFTATEGGRFLINKDYRQWVTTEGAARLNEMQIAWCMEARKGGKTGAGGVQFSTHPPVQKTTQSPVSKTAQDSPEQCVVNNTGGVQFSTHPPVQKTTQSGDPPLTSPPEIQRFQREKEKIGVVAGGHADAITGTHADARTREAPPKPAADPSAPPYPIEAESALIIHTGAHPEDPEWARAFWVKLWAAFGSVRVCSEFYEHQRWHPRECWEAALRTAVRTGTKLNTARWLEKVAARYEVQGVPVDEPVKPSPRTTPRDQKMARIAAFLTPEPKGGA